MRDFVESCRKQNLKVGLYYCFPNDFKAPEGKPPLRGLPPDSGDDPVAFVKKQLTELLTNYGPIDLLWCDQYRNDFRKDWPEIFAHIKSLQPNCIVVANNSRNLKETDVHSYEYPWLEKQKRTSLPPEGNRTPAEVCDKMGPYWFWRPEENAAALKSAEDTLRMLRLCNDRNANYLLNVAPDRSGLIPAYSLERLREIGEISRE